MLFFKKAVQVKESMIIYKYIRRKSAVAADDAAERREI